MSADDSFLSRWSRRKAQLRSSEPVGEPLPAPPVAAPSIGGNTPVPSAHPAAEASPPSTLPPLPTLEDVARLTHESDFSRFVVPGVDESVKRAAVKKLFSDPHFNLMDGLDTYIDDYGKPDPIPEQMLRRMTQSKFLRLFDADLPPAEAGAASVFPAACPDGAAAPALPQSDACEPGVDARETPPTDEDTALRLQPDDAAGPAGAGPDRKGSGP